MKLANTRAFALACRPVGKTAHRSCGGNRQSANTTFTAPDLSSGANIQSEAMARPSPANAPCSERCAGDASACNSRIRGFSCGERYPHHVLLQQIERYRQQNQILHQERHVARHRRKSGNRIPAVRHERDDGDGRYEWRTRADAPRIPNFLFQNPRSKSAAISHSETPRNQLARRMPNMGYIQKMSGPLLIYGISTCASYSHHF